MVVLEHASPELAPEVDPEIEAAQEVRGDAGVVALLHSPLTSATAWGVLPEILRGYGYQVVVPEVLDDDAPPYATKYVARAATQIKAEIGDAPVVLIGHSGAGPLLPQIGFARHSVGAPVRGYIFFDAMLPRDMRASTRLQLITMEDAETGKALQRHLAAGHRFPNWGESELRDDLTDPEDRAMLLAGLRPRGLDFFIEQLPLPEDWPEARCAFVRLSSSYDNNADTAERRGWEVYRLDLHHFAALTNAQEVGATLHAAIVDL